MHLSSGFQDIGDFKKKFDASFSLFLKIKIKNIQKNLNINNVNTLIDYVLILSSSGKRFRPYLVQSSYTYYGGKKDIGPLLFGIELLHIFALVHDDIMDQARLRHGVATAHIKYREYYPNAKENIAVSQAILLGDLLFSFAEECFLQSNLEVPKKNISAAQNEYRALVEEVIYGQMLDIDMTQTLPKSIKSIYTKMSLKSGRYSIMRPLCIGAKLAGASESDINFINIFGEQAGVAFQAQDDLLDCASHGNISGKKLYGDIKTSQQTYISYYMLNQASEKYTNLFKHFFGKNKEYSKIEQQTLSRLLMESGALDFAEKEVAKHFKKAEKALHDYAPKNNELWLQILQTLRTRKN